MTDFACERCGFVAGDVRLVEHGTDDVALCKTCFREIGEVPTRDENHSDGGGR